MCVLRKYKNFNPCIFMMSLFITKQNYTFFKFLNLISISEKIVWKNKTYFECFLIIFKLALIRSCLPNAGGSLELDNPGISLLLITPIIYDVYPREFHGQIKYQHLTLSLNKLKSFVNLLRADGQTDVFVLSSDWLTIFLRKLFAHDQPLLAKTLVVAALFK